MSILWTYRALVARVVDGDTVDLEMDLGFRVSMQVRVRLADVDTPEIYGVKHGTEEYKRGVVCSDYLKHLLPAASPCLVTTEKTGKYGRWIAHIVNHDDLNVNTHMKEFLEVRGWST